MFSSSDPTQILPIDTCYIFMSQQNNAQLEIGEVKMPHV